MNVSGNAEATGLSLQSQKQLNFEWHNWTLTSFFHPQINQEKKVASWDSIMSNNIGLKKETQA